MTASAITVEKIESVAETRRRVGLFGAWTSSFLVYFYPRMAGRTWLSISPLKACIVAVINLALAIPWFILLEASWDAWNDQILRTKANTGPYVEHPVRAFMGLFESVPRDLHAVWSGIDIAAKVSAILGIWLCLVTFLGIGFFLLMPFAARPGANRRCVLHVLRTVLLGTGFVHIFSPVVSCGLVLFAVYHYLPGLENIIGPVLLMFTVLTMWGFAALVYAASREYRREEDLPQPHDPTCDLCGYDLVAAESAGRCPECGKPVAESLGPEVRLPTAWERRPNLLNCGAIVRQLWKLIRHPQQLFVSMPTLTGHAAAHRWLAGSLVAIAGLAFFIIPAFCWTGVAEMERMNQVLGGMALGVVWSLLALMMVGIETAGIATFSRMKGNPVSLGTAAKVTAYSAVLMLPWVVLGGTQLLMMAWGGEHFVRHHMVNLRTVQIVYTGSLAVAHIGGLLWYEITVYSGIRSVQFANR